MNQQTDTVLLLLPAGLLIVWLVNFAKSLERVDQWICGMLLLCAAILSTWLVTNRYSAHAREERKRRTSISEIPRTLLTPGPSSVRMGLDVGLRCPVFLPDGLRVRHVHILGATGSGKTESVVLNFLKQDVVRGLGAVILDAKGDRSFLTELRKFVPSKKLEVFDLGSVEEEAYNPLAAGSPLEAAQRLFASLVWSEEYYKSKAISALQQLFQVHFDIHKENPSLVALSKYLDSAESYAAVALGEETTKAFATKEFQDVSGLRDQIRSLTIGHLSKSLSPAQDRGLRLESSRDGTVIYFRLQSLMSPQLVATIGKLVINHLNFIAGSSHREGGGQQAQSMTPVYFDEFASFACPEFADLISKARSAGLALHFAHQSIGDISDVSPGFLNRLTDNAGTKIVFRVNDPDTAEFFARSFGTRLYQKATHRVTNAKNIEAAEVLEEGTVRDARQFRAAPDHLKTLPTGFGAVLVAHGVETPHGGSTVFTIKFPALGKTGEVGI